MKVLRYVFTMIFLLSLCGCSSSHHTQTNTLAEGYILIDPGHGGMDGGTTAEDGTKEKDINLLVGSDLRDMLIVCGFPVSMTREEDVSIHSDDAGTVREKKVSDMHNRLAMYEAAALVFSIHQNHFSAAKYHGAQMFYSPNHPDSRALASAIRKSVSDQVQPDNKREIKKATDGIFLLYHTQRPAVLIECGFLSNAAERELLKTTAYRQSLAYAVVGGYWNYITEQRGM